VRGSQLWLAIATMLVTASSACQGDDAQDPTPIGDANVPADSSNDVPVTPAIDAAVEPVPDGAALDTGRVDDATATVEDADVSDGSETADASRPPAQGRRPFDGGYTQHEGKLPIFPCGHVGRGEVAKLVALDGDQDFLAVSNWGEIRRFRLSDFQEMTLFETPHAALAALAQPFASPLDIVGEVAITGDRRIVAADVAGELHAWDLASGRLVPAAGLSLMDFDRLSGSLVQHLASDGLRAELAKSPRAGAAWSRSARVVAAVSACGVERALVHFWRPSGELVRIHESGLSDVARGTGSRQCERRSARLLFDPSGTELAVAPDEQSYGAPTAGSPNLPPYYVEVHETASERWYEVSLLPPAEWTSRTPGKIELGLMNYVGDDLVVETYYSTLYQQGFRATYLSGSPRTVRTEVIPHPSVTVAYARSKRALAADGARILTTSGVIASADYTVLSPWTSYPEVVRPVTFSPDELSLVVTRPTRQRRAPSCLLSALACHARCR
jgi:hypothetical protein